MSEALTIQLPQPVAGLCVVRESAQPSRSPVASTPTEVEPTRAAPSPGDERREASALKQQRDELVQLCQTVRSLAARLNDLHQQTVAHHRGEIAKLAVEIARKILMRQVEDGAYDIQTIVEEALKRAPARQNLVVHLNPEDLTACQQFQQENPDTQFAELDLVGDWSVDRANCLIETPKGIVKSFVEEHLERIAEALEKAQ